MKKILSIEGFKETLIKGEANEKLNYFLDTMNEAKKYQHYLNSNSFNKLNEYNQICRNISSIDESLLNPAQKHTVNFIKNHTEEPVNLSSSKFTANENEGGFTRKYTNPNGFISIITILTTTFITGLSIAAVLIAKLK